MRARRISWGVATPPVQSKPLPAPVGPRPRHVAVIVALAVGSDFVAMQVVRLALPGLPPLAFDVLSLALATLIGVPLLWFLMLRHFHREALDQRARLEETALAAHGLEDQLRTFLETTLEGVWVFGADGRTVFANRRMEELLGVGPGALVGHTFFDHMDEEAKAFTRGAHGRRSLVGHAERYDARFRRADGTDLWAVVSATPLPDHAGATGGVIAMLTDITERKRAEDEARRLASAFDQASDAVFITDADGVIVWVNGAFEHITGFARPEAIGKTPRILRSDSHEPGFYADLWNTIRAGRVYRGMMINRRKSGELYFLDETITPIVNEGGRITHYVAAGRAILPGGDADVSTKPKG